MLSKTFIDFSFIYPNTTIIKYGLKISFVFSRLFFSLCVFSFVMMVIFIFGCIYYFYFYRCNVLRIERWKSLLLGSYLRLVSSTEYFYIFLFIGSFFDSDLIFEFVYSYRFPPYLIKSILIFSFILLLISILIKVIVPFFSLKVAEKS